MKEKTAGIKKYIKVAGNVICGLSVLFLLAALVRTDLDVSQVSDWRLFLPVFAAGVLLKTATVFMSASAWRLWLEFFSKKRCDRKEALRVYAKANIGKYLPGNVMHYVERNLFAAKLELSQTQIAAASICEIISLVLAAFFMGTIVGFSGMQKVLTALCRQVPFFQTLCGWGRETADRSGIVWAVWILAAAVVGLAVLIWKKRGRARRCKKLSSKEVFLFFQSFLISFLIYAAVLVILGLVLVLFYWYLGGRPDVRQAAVMTAAYMIAWVSGFVIPGAPGGIGVREMALTLLLTPVTGRDSIVVLSVFHRFVTVVGDFAAYLIRYKI